MFVFSPDITLWHSLTHRKKRAQAHTRTHTCTTILTIILIHLWWFMHEMFFLCFFKAQFKSSYLYSNASKNISHAILTGYMHATLEKIRINTLGIGNVYRLCECHMQTKSSLLNVCDVCILHSNKNIFTFKYVKVCFLMFKNIISMG